MFATLSGIAQGEEHAPVDLTPAVPVKKSVTHDHVVCLEDGEKLKMLKRHLTTSYGMTPEQYRAKRGLRSDYPMVAPAYAQKRSELATNLGLGRKPVETPVEAPAEPEPKPAPKARARRKAALGAVFGIKHESAARLSAAGRLSAPAVRRPHCQVHD